MRRLIKMSVLRKIKDEVSYLLYCIGQAFLWVAVKLIMQFVRPEEKKKPKKRKRKRKR